jgi:Ca2+-binding EF-hand superfamily protein
MNRKQFVTMYKSLSPKYDAERFARHVFRAFDLDRSDTIDFHEFLLGASITSPTSSPETKLQWTFQVFDIDGNGLLTRRECLEVVEAVVRFHYPSLAKQQHTSLEQLISNARSSMIRIFDSTLDLQADQLTMSQFVHGCLRDEFICRLLTPPATDSLVA